MVKTSLNSPLIPKNKRISKVETKVKKDISRTSSKYPKTPRVASTKPSSKTSSVPDSIKNLSNIQPDKNDGIDGRQRLRRIEEDQKEFENKRKNN